MARIYIDAGHGAIDPGAVSGDLKESDITYHIASELGDLLQTAGHSIKYSRPVFAAGPTLATRTSEANNWKADIFVSVHCNSNLGAPGTGTETYVFAFGGQAEKLALEVQPKIVAQLNMANRGVKVANYQVLRQTNMPAILIEAGFINHPTDAEKLRTRGSDFANAIYQGIRIYLGEEDMEVIRDAPSDWAKEAWAWAAGQGITDGIAPQAQCTREQVITFLYRTVIGEGKLK